MRYEGERQRPGSFPRVPFRVSRSGFRPPKRETRNFRVPPPTTLQQKQRESGTRNTNAKSAQIRTRNAKREIFAFRRRPPSVGGIENGCGPCCLKGIELVLALKRGKGH